MDLVLTIASIVIAIIAVFTTRYAYKWSSPKRKGILPPGSMGFPFIGETLQLNFSSPSIDLHTFFAKRFKRYGPIFRTNVAGRPVIVTADPEFNHFLLRQDGKLVVPWGMDTFAKIFQQSKQFSNQKYNRSLILSYFGVETLKEKLLPQMEDVVNKTLVKWSTQASVELKHATMDMTLNFGAQLLFGGDFEDAPFDASKMYMDLTEGQMCFPLNFPGSTHHKCLQIHKRLRGWLKGVVEKRLASPKRGHGNLLDHLIQDISTDQSDIKEDVIAQLLFGFSFNIAPTIASTLALAIKLLADHPTTLEELTAEHEAIFKNRENLDTPLTWSEFKSMTFTIQVINEVLRLGNIAPGLYRRAMKDIPVNGYIIPQGWGIIIASSAMHLNPSYFEDPLSFNPGRWKDINPEVVSKCFMPFGSGMKQCAGAEYSRAFMAAFLHVLVSKYRWKMVKGGKIVRSPLINFPDGFHFKISKKKT
ncbi:OLC1v1005494C1 [Oldenlandia corymbosa var. corymbosa]|uniref:OLC1v1005494C1 n=1 Tax=Oldenlandia corymbosa var. corymbosa TaxID=529605 RepID=A0AAV1DGQ7_OLDCO|nr:OLC1v1005494C1 [Oldenlandia corymbosa var. corymbosa]